MLKPAETDILNVHVSRQIGKLLLAAEYSEVSSTYNDGTTDWTMTVTSCLLIMMLMTSLVLQFVCPT